jgi:PAS domain S-box-containing protein
MTDDQDEISVAKRPAKGSGGNGQERDSGPPEQFLEPDVRLEAEVIRNANLALTQDLSLERILDTLLDYLRKLVPFDSANVFLAEGESHFVVGAIRGYEEFLADAEAVKTNTLSAETNALIAELCASKRSVLVADTRNESRWQTAASAEHIRNWIGVPLVVKDKVIGLYALDKAQPNFFTTEHVRRAESLAAHAATAIHHAQLFKRIEQNTAELEQRMIERDHAVEQIHFQASLLSQVRNAVIAIDNNGRVIHWNCFAEKLYQWTAAEALGEDIFRLVVPVAGHEYGQELMLEIRENGYWEGEFTVQRKDGSTFPVLVHESVLRGSNGEVIGMVGVSIDLTERKRAEEALREAKANTDSILASVADSHTLFDREWRYVYVNDAAVLAIGRPREEILGRTLWELSPDIIGTELERHYRLAMDDRVPVSFDFYYPARDSWWQNRFYPAPVGVAVFATDVSEVKRTEQELRKQKEILETIFDHIPVMISFYGEDGRVKLVNREWQLVRGWSKRDIQFKHLDLLAEAYPDARDRKRARDFIARGNGEWADFTMQLKDGRILNTSWAAVRLSDGMRINIGKDITERKRNEEKLLQYEKVVENLEEMIVVVDREYRYLLANQAFLDYRGVKREQILGRNVSEILDPDVFRREVKPRLDECFRGKAVKYELSYDYRARGERRLSVSYFPIEGPEGIDRAACVLRDITERRRAEEAVREAEQKYRDIFENAGEGIFQTTPEGRYLVANPALVQMHGFASSAELIDSLKDISRDVYVDPAKREEFKQLIEAQGFVRGFEHQIRKRDGRKIWITVNARAVRDSRGKTLYYEGTTQDINERKLAENRSAAFAALARMLSGATTKLEAARIIADTARELFEWHSCNLDLYDPDSDVVHPILNLDTIDGRLTDVTARAADRKPTIRNRRVIEQGPLLILREDPIRFDNDAVPFGDTLKPSASIMTAPIRHASRVVGLLSIQSYQSGAYDAETLNVFQSLADHCGEALNRIHAEELFYESEERFRQLAHHFEDVVWLTDREGSKVLYINPAYERMFRRTCESLYTRLESFMDVVHPDDREGVTQLLERQRQGNHEPAEYRIIWPDGSEHWIHRRSIPIRNTEGEIYLVAGIVQDITERKRAAESVTLFRNLIEQSSDAIEIIDPVTLRFIDCNESAHRTLGYSREEFLSLTIFDIDPLIDPAMLRRFDEDMIETGFATLESLHRRKDGTTFPVEVNVKLVKLERVYRLAIVRDITRRKQAEEALRASEERYRELFENAKDAIYVHDLSGHYVSVNRAAESLSGFSRDEILGKHYSNFVSPRNLRNARTNLCKKLDEENETVYEVFMITKDRRAVPVEVSSRLIYEKGEPIGVQGIVRDITERRRAQEALQTYSRRLIEAQEAERQHIARELHDEIGQVLTAVKINLQSIQRLGPDAAWLAPLDESIGIVDEALGRVRELSIELRPSLLDDLGLSAALRWYVDRYAQRTGIIAEVVNDFSGAARLSRELETACFRIAQEALTNTVRHAQAKRVSVRLARSRDKVLLTITDDGAGFDVADLFSNANTVAALGLRGMEERALAVGGKLEIESAHDGGTRICASFPLKQSEVN